MLIPIAALLLTYALTVLIATLAAVALWRPLLILLAELCGTEQRSRFWSVWTVVMMMATPLLFVSLHPVATDPTDLVQGTMTSALFGILLALVGMGYAVWSRTPGRADHEA
jgi:ABC-type transporter Mla maintaining outer membrane lipid asymmetry permease subunit MlaE